MDNSKKNDLIYYFLIALLFPRKKIFEIINSNNNNIYVEAQEILGNYLNLKRKDLISERTKIESDENSFYIYVTPSDLIFISCMDKRYFSSENNFELFDEIDNYMTSNIQKRKTFQSFLFENEKNDIRQIINKYIEEIIIMHNIEESNSTSTVNEILQVKDEKNTINEENIKSIMKNNNAFSLPKTINNTVYLKEEKKNSKLNLSKKPIFSIKPNEKSKNEIHLPNKSYIYNQYNYNNLNFGKTKPDGCSKLIIIIILIATSIIQIISIPLVIKYFDFPS